MQQIHLDLSIKGIVLAVFAKQGDVGRKFEAEITDNGVPLDLSGNVFSAWYSGTSGEGNYSQIGNRNAFSVDGNKVTVEMISQMLSVKGGGSLCLIMNGPDGEQIGLWNIPYITEGIPGNESDEATAYYTAFAQTVSELRPVLPGSCVYIGENGNWWTGDTDTGIKAEGPQGEPGYTPQKGVDYYTEADQKELVKAVLDAMPAAEEGTF